ncbi:MAG: polymer-forming cytoskeletal protein [Polyangiaceae bacterium]
MSGRGPLRIEGKVNGDVSVDGNLELCAGASVDGDIAAASLELAGNLQGDAKCSGAIVIRAGAEVKGDLVGASVSIEAGSVVDVRLDTEFELDFSRARR